MKGRKNRRKLTILILSALLVVELIMGGYAMFRSSSAIPQERYVNKVEYNAISSADLVVHLEKNMLYNASIANDPRVIFHNITGSASIFFNYSFASTSPLPAQGYFLITEDMKSGTLPSWEKNVTLISENRSWDSTYFSNGTLLELNADASLSYIYSIDQQLNLSAGNPTITYTFSYIIYAGGSVLNNASAIALTFAYPFELGAFDPYNWSYATVSIQNGSMEKGNLTTVDSVAVGSGKGYFEELAVVSLAISAVVALALALAIPREEKDPVERFISSNEGEIIRLAEDPRTLPYTYEMGSLEEMQKLSEQFGLPLLLYENGKSYVLAIQKEGVGYYFESQKKQVEREGKMKYRKLKSM